MTTRYTRLNSLDAISHAFQPPPKPSPWSGLRSLASSPRHLAVLLAVVSVLGLGYILSGSESTAVVGLGWATGRYGAERTYARLMENTLQHVTPQMSWKDQMVEGRQFLTAMMFGGQSNQLLGMYNLLYMGKELGRTVIIPPFTAIHFDGQQRPFNLIYDLPRFYAATGVPAIPLGFLKSPAKPAELKTDLVTCWSTMEIYTGAVNNHQVESGFTAHGVATNFWALPRFPRSSEGAVIEFRPLLDFLGNRTRQLEWVEETKRDLLPQKPVKEGVELKEGDRAENIKPYFDPVHWRAPTEDEQITCVDATFYVGHSVPPPPYPQHIPLEPWRGQAWKDVGQHLHFIPEVVEIADAYLQRIFGVSRGRDAPPYISVHIRRGDFKQFHGNTFTPLANYVTSVSTLRRSLQERLDAPLSTAERGGKPALKRFATPPAEYEVVVTSDEEEDSGLWREVEELGWKRVDHTSLETRETYGEWYPSMLDGEILSRGQGFVGTQWSTLSMVSGLRVEYWQGGLQVVADPR